MAAETNRNNEAATKKRKKEKGRVVSRFFQPQTGPSTNRPDHGEGRTERRREKRKRTHKKERVVSRFFQPKVEVPCSQSSNFGVPIADSSGGIACIEERVVTEMKRRLKKTRRSGIDSKPEAQDNSRVPNVEDGRAEQPSLKKDRVVSPYFQYKQPSGDIAQSKGPSGPSMTEECSSIAKRGRVDGLLSKNVAVFCSKESPDIDELFSQFVYRKESKSDSLQSRKRVCSPCSYNRDVLKCAAASTICQTFAEVEDEAKAAALVKTRKKKSCSDAKCEKIGPLRCEQINAEAEEDVPSKAKKKKRNVGRKCQNIMSEAHEQTNEVAGIEDPVKAKMEMNTRGMNFEITGPLTPMLNNAEEQVEPQTFIKVKKKKNVSHSVTTLKAAEKRKDAYRRKDADNPWKPPPSIHQLLQEDHAHDPWRVLVICMLLNCTQGKQTEQILGTLFSEFPNAKAAAEAPSERIEEIIKTLGLQKKRSHMIKRMSQEYLGNGWTHVTQLHGVGKYAADAYAIFCTGRWYEVSPVDHKLKDYWDYLWTIEDKLLI